jgi:hypothetical protein
LKQRIQRHLSLASLQCDYIDFRRRRGSLPVTVGFARQIIKRSKKSLPTLASMNCWLWLAFFFVFVVVPEMIKAFQIQNDYLCILNPDGGISLAQRQRLQRQWVRTTKSVAGRIAHWKISRKVTMLLQAIAIMFLVMDEFAVLGRIGFSL